MTIYDSENFIGNNCWYLAIFQRLQLRTTRNSKTSRNCSVISKQILIGTLFMALIVMICRFSIQSIWVQCLELKNRFGSFLLFVARKVWSREKKSVLMPKENTTLENQEKHIPKRINRFVACVTLFISVFGLQGKS